MSLALHTARSGNPVRYALDSHTAQALGLWLRATLVDTDLSNVYANREGLEYPEDIRRHYESIQQGDPTSLEGLHSTILAGGHRSAHRVPALNALRREYDQRSKLLPNAPEHSPFLNPQLVRSNTEAGLAALHKALNGDPPEAHAGFFGIPAALHAVHPALGQASRDLIRRALHSGDLPTLLDLHHMVVAHQALRTGLMGQNRQPTFPDVFSARWPLEQGIKEHLASANLATYGLKHQTGSDHRPNEMLPEDYYAL